MFPPVVFVVSSWLLLFFPMDQALEVKNTRNSIHSHLITSWENRASGR